MTTTRSQADLIGGTLAYSWSGLANGESGDAAAHGGTGDRTVQVTGTFGAGGTVLVEGSLNGTDWFTLRDTLGVSLSFTSSGLRALLENAVWIRPKVSAGDGTTSINVTLAVRR